MRNINRSFALSSDSLPEVKASVEMEVLRLRALGMTASGRGIFPAHLLNYIVSWYLSQPRRVRDMIAMKGERIFVDRATGPPRFWNVYDDEEEGGEPPSGLEGGHGAVGKRPSGKPPTVKGHPGRRHPRKDGSEGQDAAVPTEDRPHHRS